MLPNNKPCTAVIDVTGEFNNAKIEVSNPNIIRINGLKHCFQK